MTSIGERRHRIMFERPIETRGTSGQPVVTWEHVADVWAKVSYRLAGSKEDIMADQVVSQAGVVFDIAYRNGINAKMRITFESELYDILFIQYPDLKQSVLLYAQVQDK